MHQVSSSRLLSLLTVLTQLILTLPDHQVVQSDKFTLSLRLRTPLSQGWLHLSWHPTAARVCLGQPPHRGDVTEAFSFAEQVGHLL